jgi:hypothetical protein
MTRNLKRLIFVLFCALATAPCPLMADNLVIKVSDYENKGIQSRVMYKDGVTSSVLGDTDSQGVLNREYKCKDGQVMRAHPNDIGTYFESRDEPCGIQMVLKVVKRQTPRGIAAINFRVENIKFQDGSPGVIIYKPFFQTTTSEAVSTSACQVDINTIVDQEVFRQDNQSSWIPVKRGETSLSTIGAGMAKPDHQVVLLPSNCDTSAPRLRQLQDGTADSVTVALGRANIVIGQSIRELGLQSQIAPQ